MLQMSGFVNLETDSHLSVFPNLHGQPTGQYYPYSYRYPFILVVYTVHTVLFFDKVVVTVTTVRLSVCPGN